MSNNEITFFAKTNFRNQERVFGIKTDDRRRHMYIIGKTGMGKTNLLENLAVQDIRNGHGICFIDPHGDTAEKLLKAVPSHRINDVIYLNPADQNFPLAFNVMESVDPDYRHLVASGLIGVFKKIWADSWGPRLEYILRNAILALLEYPGSTLLGVTRILVDKKYREKVVEKVTDPVIRQFWVDEFPKWSDKVLQEVVSPIQNKVGQFLSSSLIRNIVGQTKSSFDIRQAMDSQKILILNLSKGRIGEDNSALLGAMMITKIQLAAMGRVDMEEDLRRDFYLYVDEFQNFSTESFANILSEARKYRLNLILANQYVEQIIETVRNAIFGNVGTIVSFRVGATDAEFLEKEFAPVFTQNDIVNLPKYNIYLKLMIDGIAGDAFSATVLPPIYIGDTIENEAKIIAASRERYAAAKEEVEENISRWAGIMPAGGFKTVNHPQTNFSSEQQNFQQPHQNSRPNFSAAGSRPSAPIQSQTQQIEARNAFVAAPEASRAPEPQKPIEQQPSISIAPGAADDLGEYNQPDISTATIHDEAPKPVFEAICDMCGDSIQVPFMPDGKRPTFCKECLKEYQRMTAKEKLAQERKMQRDVEEVQQQTQQQNQNFQRTPRQQVNFQTKQQFPKYQPERRPEPFNKKIEYKTIQPQDHPMSLSQMQYIAPKKFKPQRQKPNVNLDEVRNLINKTRGDQESK